MSDKVIPVAIEISEAELEVLGGCLGLRYAEKPYRNVFHAPSDSPPRAICEGLVSRGIMAGPFGPGGGFFHVVSAVEVAVLNAWRKRRGPVAREAEVGAGGEPSIRDRVAEMKRQVDEALREQERSRKALRDEVLKLAWKIGVPQDDKDVLAAADLTLTHLVQTVGRWVDGAIERQAEKRRQALWMEAVVPQLMAELEAMLANDGGPGACYSAVKLSDARAEVQRLLQQLRDAGVEPLTMRGVEAGGATGGGA